jgi:hypothetical protein
MRKLNALKIAAAALALALPMTAQAAVTYQLAIAATDYEPAAGFSFTIANPVTANVTMPVVSLTNCFTGYSDTICRDPSLMITAGGTQVIFATRQFFHDGDEVITSDVSSFYYFGLDAFTTNGAHNDGWGEATLTVSGVPADIGDTPVDPPAVPEPANWALMVGGFGFVGGILRRRSTGVRLAAI